MQSFILSNLLILTQLIQAAGQTCPPEYSAGSNSYSLTRYGEDRLLCTDACNAENYCCTLDAGGCATLSCTSGCHLAWFASNVADCKAQCDTLNNNGECSKELPRYSEVSDLNLNPTWPNNDGTIATCTGHSTCGCTGTGFGSDCGSAGCSRACELANLPIRKSNFFHGASVIIDRQIGISSSDLLASIAALHNHVEATALLSGSQIITQTEIFKTNAELLETEKPLMEAALNLVDAYETNKGALFINAASISGFVRNQPVVSDNKEMERTMIVVQQAILDNIYSTSNIVSTCSTFLSGRKWKTSFFFPGHVDHLDIADATTIHVVKIKATHTAYWGRKVAFADAPVRKATGLYLVPGQIASITVPSKIVNQGYTITVGCHSSDNKDKTTHRRMDRIFTSFAVLGTVVKVANPLGGNVYLEVPYLAEHGTIDISITGGVVKAPRFSVTSVFTTSSAEWNAVRTAPGKWADIESDRFLLQVPSIWISGYDYIHMKTLLDGYNTAMEGMLEFGGYAGGGFQKTTHVLYIQPDLQIKEVAYGTGYPQVNINIGADANGPKADGPVGKSTHWMVTNPMGWYVCYHELGHSQLHSMYLGESEAYNNIYFAYIQNVKHNINFDEAFKKSLHNPPLFTVDGAAVNWMTTLNFRNGVDMDRTGSEENEFRYQLRGYAKYADIARLFQWKAMIDFNHQENLDALNGCTYDSGMHPENCDAGTTPPGALLDRHDSRTLRLSIAAGTDLTPLIHFWGISPTDAVALKAAVDANTLGKSKKVRDLLVRYREIVPANNIEFNTHYEESWPGRPTNCPSTKYGCGWYNQWRDVWDASYATLTKDRIDALLIQYFGSKCGASENCCTWECDAVDECIGVNCGGASTCYDGNSKYICTCATGWTGGGDNAVCTSVLCNSGSSGIPPNCGTCDRQGYKGTSTWSGSVWSACSTILPTGTAAQCQTIANDEEKFCPSDQYYDSTKQFATCVSAACEKNNAADVSACCSLAQTCQEARDASSNPKSCGIGTIDAAGSKICAAYPCTAAEFADDSGICCVDTSDGDDDGGDGGEDGSSTTKGNTGSGNSNGEKTSNNTPSSGKTDRISYQGETGIQAMLSFNGIIGLVIGGCVILVVIGVCIAMFKCKKSKKPTKESAVAIEMVIKEDDIIGWEKVFDETEQAYFYHHKQSDLSTWDPPNSHRHTRVSFGTRSRNSTGSVLPEGWVRHLDESSGNYYYESASHTRNTTWTKPDSNVQSV